MTKTTTITTQDTKHDTTIQEQYIHVCSEIDEIGVEIIKKKYLNASLEICDAIASLTKLLNQIIDNENLKATPQELMDITIKKADIRRYYEIL